MPAAAAVKTLASRLFTFLQGEYRQRYDNGKR